MIMQSTFQRIVSILVIMHLIGCTSLKPIETGPDDLQDKIRYENIVSIHDWVRVITEDGKEYRFQVTAIDEKEVRGDDVVNNNVVSVPIDSIVALEIQEINTGKNSLLVGTGVAIYALFFILLILAGTAGFP